MEVLDLGCNLLEGSSCGEGLAALLRKNRSITSLNLEQNALGDEGTVLLAEALEDHPLRVFNLTVNRIGDLGARAIALVLQHRPDFPLERVQLANNLISDEGMSFLAEGIALNPRFVSGPIAPSLCLHVPC